MPCRKGSSNAPDLPVFYEILETWVFMWISLFQVWAIFPNKKKSTVHIWPPHLGFVKLFWPTSLGANKNFETQRGWSPLLYLWYCIHLIFLPDKLALRGYLCGCNRGPGQEARGLWGLCEYISTSPQQRKINWAWEPNCPVQILVLPLTSCVTSGKLLNFSGPPFPHF